MNLRRAIGSSIVATLLACGPSATPPPQHTTSSLPPGNAAVQARISTLPPPPTPWSTLVGTLTPDDFVTLCPYLIAHSHLEGGDVACPDGSTATLNTYECEPERMSAAARSLPCSISLGEIVACRLATVAAPCGDGHVGEDLPECEAFDACNPTRARTP
jgi:hypothetical protein